MIDYREMDLEMDNERIYIFFREKAMDDGAS